MKPKLMLIGAFLFCLSLKTHAQNLIDGRVVGTIPFGNDAYSIIQEEQGDNTFQTSPHPMGALQANQTLQLLINQDNEHQVEVIASSLSTPLFAQLVTIEPNINTTLPNFTEPIVENGILFFQNKAHIAEVYEALTTFTDQGDMDEQLDIFQAEYPGYRSFREYIIQTYNWLEGSLSQQQLSELYDEDFIADEIKKTFLNENRMVGVADSVYYFHDIGGVYRFGKENRSLIQIFEDMDRDEEPLDPASNAFQHILEIDIMDGNRKIVSHDRGEISVETGSEDSCWYVTRLTYASDVECDPFTKGFSIYLVEYFQPAGGVRDSSVYWVGGMELEVKWGDGSISNFDNYNNQFIYHTFAEYVVYHPQTKLIFTDRYGNEQVIEDGNETEDGIDILFNIKASCGKNDALEYNHDNEGGFQIVGRVWINDNILGNHIGSATHLYKWQDDGSLELVKGTLFTDVSGKFFDRFCDYKDEKYGDKLRKRRRKIQKVKNKWFRYYRYDAKDGVKSTHWFVKDGQFSELNGHVSPC